MHDSSRPDLTKDGQGASIEKLFITFQKVQTQYINIYIYINAKAGGLIGISQGGLFEYVKEGNKASLIQYCQHYEPQYWHHFKKEWHSIQVSEKKKPIMHY